MNKKIFVMYCILLWAPHTFTTYSVRGLAQLRVVLSQVARRYVGTTIPNKNLSDIIAHQTKHVQSLKQAGHTVTADDIKCPIADGRAKDTYDPLIKTTPDNPLNAAKSYTIHDCKLTEHPSGFFTGFPPFDIYEEDIQYCKTCDKGSISSKKVE